MASFIRILISLRQDLIAAPAADVAMLNSIAEFAVSSWSQIADAHCQVFRPQTGSSQVLRRRSSCSSGRVFQEDDPFHPQQTRRWDSELGIQLAAELSSLWPPPLPAAITPLHPESPGGAPPVPDRSEPLAIPQSGKKPRSGSLSGFGSFGNLQLASSSKRKSKMHSPHTAPGRRGSLGLSSSASAEDSCLFVDNLIRGVQQRLRSELGFREVVVATGEEADTDSGRSRTLLAGSILNDHESPSKSEEPQPWEATAASKRQLLYGKDVDRKNSDASLCSECAKGTVYVSDGYENKQRLLVIVPYREAGIWSRSICMNQFDSDSDSGSMMSYLKKALSENYGVVIMNPAAQSCHPRTHVESAWDQLVAPLISEVFIVAFSRGAQMVLHLLNYDNGQGVMQDRVKALALVEPSHYVSDSDTYFARRMLARRAVAWILNSEIDVGSKIPQGHARHGCVCVSAGTVPSNVLGSSGAYALEMVKSSVFGSFAARSGEAAGITVNASKISACGICHRKLSMLNRRIPCSWCEVKYCSRCCEDKFVPAFGSWRVCSLCQSLPCLIDPRRKNRSATNHTSPTAAAQERCSVFIRPTADDDDPVCLGDFEIVKLVGRGACGRVKLVRKKHGYDEGVFYAMKAIRKKLVIQRGLVEATNAERRILDRIKHPVERKGALFEGQYALMEKHAKEYRTEDIFETYMNTVEVPIDTPASVKSSNDELFNDFAFNYMDGPDEEQRDIPEPDEEGEEESPLSPVSPNDSTERSSKPRPLTVKEDKMLATFLSTNGSHFDLTLLRPNQATDFGVSACSSLSSEGTDDEAAEPVEQLDDLEATEKDKKDKKKPSSPTTQPVSPSSNDGTDVDSVLTKTGSNSTDAAEEVAKAS
ncbi:hypothetical protein PC121_g11899 [Phytophthora cactorum]|nr:hypothetical protein PC121_g11899 [Phytophthora cactorum]